MKLNNKQLEIYGVNSLSFREEKEINGGIIGLIISAFWAGVVYGYVKEKFDSEEWSL